MPIIHETGKELFPRDVCDDCIEADRRTEREIANAQSRHTLRLETNDRETSIADLIKAAGANPWEHGSSSFDNYDSESSPKALGRARGFAAATRSAAKYEPVRGLYLYGDTGTGKTHLGVAVMRWLIENDYPADRIVFDHSADLIARIQDTYGKKEASTMDVVDRRIDAGLWILDDFGTERASDDVVRHITLIFTRRALRPTLVTSNYGPETMMTERPELFRAVSRFGPRYFATVPVTGQDRRFVA